MRDHYDFSGGVRGKYAARFADGNVVIVVDGDIPRNLDGNPIERPKPNTSAKTKRRAPTKKARRRKG